MNVAFKAQLLTRLESESYLWEDDPGMTAAGLIEYYIMVDFEHNLKKALGLHVKPD
jgi:hypothetical protein